MVTSMTVVLSHLVEVPSVIPEVLFMGFVNYDPSFSLSAIVAASKIW